MAKQKVKCETVTITITDEDGNGTSMVVPAYTRSFNQMEKRIAEVTENYLRLSKLAGQPMSTGDYALFVLTNAASEPTEV